MLFMGGGRALKHKIMRSNPAKDAPHYFEFPYIIFV